METKKVKSEEKYCKTPNKRPWAFASLISSKRALFPFNSLRNENQTISG